MGLKARKQKCPKGRCAVDAGMRDDNIRASPSDQKLAEDPEGVVVPQKIACSPAIHELDPRCARTAAEEMDRVVDCPSDTQKQSQRGETPAPQAALQQSLCCRLAETPEDLKIVWKSRQLQFQKLVQAFRDQV